MLDVLIIGSGGAALSAALKASDDGAKVAIATKGELTNSQTVMAQGGINAALGNLEDDSIEKHIQDTLKAAKDLADKKMVEQMCSQAPLSIAYLETLGVNFSRINADAPLKSIAQRKLGGASSKRACYAQDYTGLKIAHTMIDAILNRDIEIFTHHFLLNLIVEDGLAKGAIFLDIDSGDIKEIWAKTVVVATGGFGALYYNHTTNNHAASGDGLVAILKGGGAVSNMEFVQFHPTALKSSLVLISESARGEGGYLINSDGKRFVDELAPRDEVAAAIYKELQDGKEVYLDLRHLDSAHLQKVMPQELNLCKVYEGVDATKELIPIRPVTHYTMGGVEVDNNLEVDGIKNCYCAGEASNAKVHGANRLGGNSLLEIVAFGRAAGESAANRAKGVIFKEPDDIFIKEATKAIEYLLAKDGKSFYSARKELGDIFFEDVGIIREQKGLNRALERVKTMQLEFADMGIKDRSKVANGELIEFLEFANMLTLAPVVISMALARQESRGAHIRADFPNSDNNFLKSFIFRLRGVNEDNNQ